MPTLDETIAKARENIARLDAGLLHVQAVSRATASEVDALADRVNDLDKRVALICVVGSVGSGTVTSVVAMAIQNLMGG